VWCNDTIANDPTIQVGVLESFQGERKLKESYDLGVLGLINGIFGADDNDRGYIAAVHDVVCEGGCSPEGAARALKVGDECPVCGGELCLGPLQRFEALGRG
jgi:hypothetical protein